jgi:hypothetical protein
VRDTSAEIDGRVCFLLMVLHLVCCLLCLQPQPVPAAKPIAQPKPATSTIAQPLAQPVTFTLSQPCVSCTDFTTPVSHLWAPWCNRCLGARFARNLLSQLRLTFVC